MRKKKDLHQYVTLPGENIVCRIAEQGEVHYSAFQGGQMLDPVRKLFLLKPELLDQMPDVTPEFRENCEVHRKLMGLTEGVGA